MFIYIHIYNWMAHYGLGPSPPRVPPIKCPGTLFPTLASDLKWGFSSLLQHQFLYLLVLC